MKRYGDIAQLFGEVEDGIIKLNQAYESARKDDEIYEVLKPAIKSSLENLRSILDYAAHDIWESYTKKKNSPYFPYGDDDKTFMKSVDKNLPGLAVQRPDILLLIKSVQPFSCGDFWIVDLCKNANANKHRGLTKQERRNSESSTVVIGGAIAMRNCIDSTFDNCFVNGVPVGIGGRAVISNTMNRNQLSNSLGKVPFHKEFEWVEFVFDGSLVDAKTLLSKSKTRIGEFIEELRRII